MDSPSVRAMFYLTIHLSVFCIVCQGQLSTESRLASSLEEPYHLGYSPRDLAEALEGLLDAGHDNSIALSVEKKASVIPRCDVGERCAMKHGPRIGRLCDCLRGTACNTFFLRCY